MRPYLFAALILIGSVASATAQNGPPADNGNRVNGLNFQPTPHEVLPREKQAGVAPSVQQQKQTNEELFNLDKQALRSEGLSGKSVPNPNQPH